MRKIPAWYLAALLCLPLPAMAGDWDDYYNANGEATKFMTARDYTAALAAAQQALAAADKNAQAKVLSANHYQSLAWTKLGQIQALAGNTSEAEKDYLHAISIAEKESMLWKRELLIWPMRYLQDLYYQTGNYEKAISYANQERDLARLGGLGESSQIGGLITLGKCHIKLQKPQLAKQELEQAYAIFREKGAPGDTHVDELLLTLATLYQEEGDSQKAQDMQQRAKIFVDRKNAPPMRPMPPPVNQPGFADIGTCRPNYPRASIMAEEQGTVKLEFEVGEDGQLIDSKVVESSGHPTLDGGTLDALRLCKFKAAVVDGKPVRGKFKAVYVWKLPDLEN